MNKANGFITLHRKILNWEWFTDSATLHVFLFLLLSANFTEGRFQGQVINRGQIATSLPKISTGTHLSIQQARTALLHLKSTGEITDRTFNRYRIITIVRYDEYQNLTDSSTGNQQAINRQINRQSTDNLTGNQQQYNNDNNNNKETNKQGNNDMYKGSAKRFTPPTREELIAFCQENGLEIDVDYFLDYYNGNGWMAGKNKMKDWEATVRNWARRENRGSVPQQKQQKVLPAQDFQQRSYEGVQDEILSDLSKEMAIFKATGKVDM